MIHPLTLYMMQAFMKPRLPQALPSVALIIQVFIIPYKSNGFFNRVTGTENSNMHKARIKIITKQNTKIWNMF